MARKREGDSDDESPRSKRRRLSGNAVVPKPKEDIRSAQDLHALLSPVDVDGATCLSSKSHYLSSMHQILIYLRCQDISYIFGWAFQ